jgi:cytoskeletal protein CcmA (bactofilin family)
MRIETPTNSTSILGEVKTQNISVKQKDMFCGYLAKGTQSAQFFIILDYNIKTLI